MAVGKRALSVLATGAVMAALTPFASPAHAEGEDTPEPVVSVSAFCEDAPDETFSDVDENTTHFFEIACAEFPGIVQGNPEGIGADKYGPSMDVSRAQMASFIARMVDAADALDAGDNITGLGADDGTSEFSDLDDAGVHAANVRRLEDANIVEGNPQNIGEDKYGPLLKVSRAQMASYIARAVNYMVDGFVGTTTKDFFTDDTGIVHEDNINALTDERLLAGKTADIYDPSGNVSRAQMASFIIRPLAALHEAGLIDKAREDVQPPVIVDARVATDVATAVATATAATPTATAGDVWTITFDEALATTTADGATLVVEDNDGNRAVVQCGGTVGEVEEPENTTAAACELSEGDTVLTVELLEDPVLTTGDGALTYPLTILDIGNAGDESGNEVDVADSEDDEIDVDEDTETVFVVI